jgi:hypothetical protein
MPKLGVECCKNLLTGYAAKLGIRGDKRVF